MATIGIFDSGVGGLSVWMELYRFLPREKYIYFSDNAFCPYGEKSSEIIISRARFITEQLLLKGADIIVVACNTATAAAIGTLRTEYPVSFVGIEPAVKPAAKQSKKRIVGVLATASTLKASKYLGVKKGFEADARIVESVGKGFVELVENGETSGLHAREVVAASLRPLLDEGADEIVLGCTHYPFLKEIIEEIAGPLVTVVNPAPAVARQAVRILEETGVEIGSEPGLPCGQPDVELISSGAPEPLEKMYRRCCDILQQESL